VLQDSDKRPRLQCCYCTDLNRIQANHCYDGPLCGGNFKLTRHTVNGWFSNHKNWWMFFESYIHPDNCKAVRIADLVSECKKKKMEAILENRKTSLVSLADGYAFDLDQSEYCRVNDAVLEHQKRESYMKHYADLFAELRKAKGVVQWKRSYDDRTAGGKCSTGPVEKDMDSWCSGNEFVRPKQTDFDLPAHCVPTPNNALEGLPEEKRLTLDCLTLTLQKAL